MPRKDKTPLKTPPPDNQKAQEGQGKSSSQASGQPPSSTPFPASSGVLWRRISGKAHLRNDKGEKVVVTAGQTFAFPLGYTPPETSHWERMTPILAPSVEMKSALSVRKAPGGMFHVFNTITGKNLNDKPLTREEAQSLLVETIGE